MKLALTSFSALALLAATALASPPPNTATAVGEGGGAYFDPAYPPAPQPQERSHRRTTDLGTTFEGGGVYRTPHNS